MNAFFEVIVLRKHNVKMKGRKLPSRFVVKARSVLRATQLVLQEFRATKNTSCIRLIRSFKLAQPRGEGVLNFTKPVFMRTYLLTAGRLREIPV